MKLLTAALALPGALLLHAADFSVPIEQYKLDNGLRVIVSTDKAIPVVPST